MSRSLLVSTEINAATRCLFLGIGGVLNSSRYFASWHFAKHRARAAKLSCFAHQNFPAYFQEMLDPNAIHHLNTLIDAADASVIIAPQPGWWSAGGLDHVLTALRARGFAFCDRVVAMVPRFNERQMLRWLNDEENAPNERPRRVVLLDSVPHYGCHFQVHTAPDVGIRPEHTAMVLEILNGADWGLR